MTYYLYHIPGKKIGVTRNLKDRVTKQQGYKSDEYEVLDQSEDIDYISKREIELQQSYGYKVDRKLYKDLFNNMKINATEMTSTFPVPLNKLKGRLMDNLGKSWETAFGTFTLNMDSVKWIIDNAKTSMYDENRSYIYNKAFFEEMLNKYENVSNKVAERNKEFIAALKAELVSKDNDFKSVDSNNDRFDNIRSWAKQRGLYDKGDTKTQYCKLMEEAGELGRAVLCKLMEEAGELGRAVLKDDKTEFIDAIGDMIVVLTNMAHLGGTTVEHCIDSAYEVISKRTGKMVNGTFVKDN
jgi:NTP pyrophosphatase (non-canonical NTP hydrolase)